MSGDTAAARKYPFLPPSRHVGWLPYVWLIYVAYFLVEPALNHVPGFKIVR